MCLAPLVMFVFGSVGLIGSVIVMSLWGSVGLVEIIWFCWILSISVVLASKRQC
jgi:hypothetical protein